MALDLKPNLSETVFKPATVSGPENDTCLPCRKEREQTTKTLVKSLIDLPESSEVGRANVSVVVSADENTCAEAESIDSIIKEVDKYLGPLGYGCSGRRNEVPKVWYRMEHAERYDIMKRVRSELNRLGLCGVQIDYHKNKHFVKYAEVLDRVRGERMVVCACSALVPTYRTKDGWDHAMC